MSNGGIYEHNGQKLYGDGREVDPPSRRDKPHAAAVRAASQYSTGQELLAKRITSEYDPLVKAAKAITWLALARPLAERVLADAESIATIKALVDDAVVKNNELEKLADSVCEQVKAKVALYEAEVTRLTALLAVAMEALRPFSNEGDYLSTAGYKHIPDDDRAVFVEDYVCDFTVGDCRRASQALGKLK